MTRQLIAASFTQARACDGRKESSNYSTIDNPTDVETWLANAIHSYRRFKEEVSVYPHHRRRLAYVVRVYAKEAK